LLLSKKKNTFLLQTTGLSQKICVLAGTAAILGERLMASIREKSFYLSHF
jgi:hypothetical protein